MTPGLTDCRLRARGGVGPRDPLPPSENPFNARWRLGRKRPRAKSAIYKTKRPRGEGGGLQRRGEPILWVAERALSPKHLRSGPATRG